MIKQSSINKVCQHLVLWICSHSSLGVKLRATLSSTFRVFLTNTSWFCKKLTKRCQVPSVAFPLCDPVDYSSPGSSLHGDSPGKNPGVGCHALLNKQKLQLNSVGRPEEGALTPCEDRQAQQEEESFSWSGLGQWKALALFTAALPAAFSPLYKCPPPLAMGPLACCDCRRWMEFSADTK